MTAGSAADTWRSLLEAWRLPPEVERVTLVDGWALVAHRFRAANQLVDLTDPFLQRILALCHGASTVIDVGAGAGRYTLALAPHVAHVIAVEPSPSMREMLEEDLQDRHLTNVEVVAAPWLDADVPPADVIICSHVLYDVIDLPPFVRKMNRLAQRAVIVQLHLRHIGTLFADLWRQFRGIERPTRPTYADALNVLLEEGLAASCEIAPVPRPLSWSSLEDAVDDCRARLLFPPEPQRDAQLAEYILQNSTWSEGRLYPRWQITRVAIIHWTPGPAVWM
jgi:SAM-dependent methyltransferase